MAVYFWTVYSLGLRLQEGLNLQVGEIDAARRLVHIHRRKGAKERYLPLPKATLVALRRFWATHRHPNFFFPENRASPVFRAKMRDALLAAGVHSQANSSVWQKRWEVNVQPVGDGLAVLKYLEPYVFRVAISDRRIEAVDEQSVTYRYTPSRSQRTKTKTVSGQEFVRGFLQHVLPKGFQKVRRYGWQGAHSKTKLDTVKWIVWLFLGWTYWLGSGHAPPNESTDQHAPRRQCCGVPVMVVLRTLRSSTTLLEHVLNYLDTG